MGAEGTPGTSSKDADDILIFTPSLPMTSGPGERECELIKLWPLLFPKYVNLEG